MSVLLQDAYLDKLLVLNAGDLGSIPGLEKSPGERKGYPLQYPGLENSMDYSLWGRKVLDMTQPLNNSRPLSSDSQISSLLFLNTGKRAY